MQLLRYLGLVLVLAAATGCGEANPRKAVSGKITLKGADLADGTITFRPIEGTSPAGMPSTTGGAVIANGVYSIVAESGLVPGKYKVLLSSGDGITPDNADEMPGPSGNFVSKDRIPPEYNVKSKVEIEVTEEGDNVFNFDIP